MGSQSDDPAGHETAEEFPDEFQCCVCLDLLYKPVVLACGHMSCFWCVFKAMDFWRESHCPICRNPYNHFPSICKLLHFLLLKLYPLAYKRREQQVIEEEKRSEKFSPQLDKFLSGPEPSEKLNICSGVPPHLCNNVGLGLCSMAEDDIKGASESTIMHQKDDKMSILAKSAFEATGSVASGQNCMLGDKSNGQKNSEQVLIADLLCAICKEEEKRSEKFSPQLDKFLSGPEPSEKLNICSGVPPHLCNNVGLGLCSIAEDDIKGASESTIMHQKDDKMSILAKSAFEATGSVASEQNCMLGDKSNGQKNSEQVLIADLLCAICKELLYRPVVLNCGHVFCEACICPGNEVPRCQVCQCVHPNGSPKVCLVLEHFLEEQFPERYALRKESVSNQVGAGPIQAQRKVSQSLSKPKYSYRSCLSGKRPKVHTGVGCDYCGMCPIIGERYKCKDCKEKMGFDLCEGCYNTSSKLPGRFNQRHTPEHRLKIVQPGLMYDFVWGLEDSESEEDDGPVNMEYSLLSPSLALGPPLALDPEHTPAAPASENTSEDEGGTHSSST